MTQYVDKSALITEIEKRERRLDIDNPHGRGAMVELECLKDFINTLEVNEVDLEKVFNDEYSKFSNDPDAMDYAFPIDLSDYKDFAKQFFELGLRASQNKR